jgi:hypothetical protein
MENVMSRWAQVTFVLVVAISVSVGLTRGAVEAYAAEKQEGPRLTVISVESADNYQKGISSVLAKVDPHVSARMADALGGISFEPDRLVEVSMVEAASWIEKFDVPSLGVQGEAPSEHRRFFADFGNQALLLEYMASADHVAMRTSLLPSLAGVGDFVVSAATVRATAEDDGSWIVESVDARGNQNFSRVAADNDSACAECNRAAATTFGLTGLIFCRSPFTGPLSEACQLAFFALGYAYAELCSSVCAVAYQGYLRLYSLLCLESSCGIGASAATLNTYIRGAHAFVTWYRPPSVAVPQFTEIHTFHTLNHRLQFDDSVTRNRAYTVTGSVSSNTGADVRCTVRVKAFVTASLTNGKTLFAEGHSGKPTRAPRPCA